MRLEFVDPGAYPDWDERIARLPKATVFHGAKWAAVLRETYGFSAVYAAAFEGPSLVGVLPLMEARSWLRGRRGIGLPFTDHCSTVASEPRVSRLLYASALNYGRARQWRTIEIRGGAGGLRLPPAICYVRHVLDLRAGRHDGDEAMRRAGRKAERAGVTVEFATGVEATREFYGLYCLTRRRQGVPPASWRFFAAVQRHLFGSAGCVALARRDGRAIAGAVFLHFDRTALFKFGASDPAALPFRANNLVLCRANAWHAARGFTTIDFGRTSPQNLGLRRFKRSLGAQEQPLEYVRINCRTERCESLDDTTQRWPTQVMRNLPSWTLRLIGRAAYRHFA